MIQEIFGVNPVMRDIDDGFAKLGYFACYPNLFWRQEPGVRLTDKSKEEWGQAFNYLNGFDFGNGVGDLIATRDHLYGLDHYSGKSALLAIALAAVSPSR